MKFLFSLIFTNVLYGQRFVFDQYQQNLAALNPAATGLRSGSTAQVVSVNQIVKNTTQPLMLSQSVFIDGSPLHKSFFNDSLKTVYLEQKKAFEMGASSMPPVDSLYFKPDIRSSFGFVGYRGSNVGLNSTYISANYAYNLMLSDATLKIGVLAGLYFLPYNFGQISTKLNYSPTFGVGLLYHTADTYFGIAMPFLQLKKDQTGWMANRPLFINGGKTLKNDLIVIQPFYYAGLVSKKLEGSLNVRLWLKNKYAVGSGLVYNQKLAFSGFADYLLSRNIRLGVVAISPKVVSGNAILQKRPYFNFSARFDFSPKTDQTIMEY